jgi:hypothetical protein
VLIHRFTSLSLGLLCFLPIEIQGNPMPQPLSQILWLTLLFLAVGNLGSMAIENQSARPGRALVHGPRVNCSQHEAPLGSLDPPTTSALPHHGEFVAGKYFKENISPAAEVRISWLGATFMRRFAVKVEDNTDDVTLQTYTLSRASTGTQIVVEFGDHHETKLADLWCLLKLQANGEDGALQTSAVPNIFFVRDATGVLGAVDALWAGAGWEIGASPVEGHRQWPSGSRVIAR